MEYPELTNSNLAPCPLCGELPSNSFYREQYGHGSAGTGYRIACEYCGVSMEDDGYDAPTLGILVGRLESQWNKKWGNFS